MLPANLTAAVPISNPAVVKVNVAARIRSPVPVILIPETNVQFPFTVKSESRAIVPINVPRQSSTPRETSPPKVTIKLPDS